MLKGVMVAYKGVAVVSRGYVHRLMASSDNDAVGVGR